MVENFEHLCVEYGYPDVEGRFAYTWGSSGYVVGADGSQEPVTVFDEDEVKRFTLRP